MQSSLESQQVLYTTPQLLIQVEHLSRIITASAGKTVILDDVTFNVSTGSLFAINGPSGSGKSTLLNMLTGIDRPTSGRILFEGQELRAMSESALVRWRGQHVGIVFQFFQLIPTLTSLENVLLALELGRVGGTTPLQILGYPDLQHIQAGTLQLISGRLPGPGEIAMDTSDKSYAPVALGDTVVVNTPNGQTVSLRVVGETRLTHFSSEDRGHTWRFFIRLARATTEGRMGYHICKRS